jgi:hypothetical protein
MLKDLTVCEDMPGWEDETGCHWDTRANYMYTRVLPSCGCGSPRSIAGYVVACLKKYTDDSSRPDYEDLPAMFFLSWADHEDYIEHGSTIRCSWLTDKGKELIRDLETVMKEEDA